MITKPIALQNCSGLKCASEQVAAILSPIFLLLDVGNLLRLPQDIITQPSSRAGGGRGGEGLVKSKPGCCLSLRRLHCARDSDLVFCVCVSGSVAITVWQWEGTAAEEQSEGKEIIYIPPHRDSRVKVTYKSNDVIS